MPVARSKDASPSEVIIVKFPEGSARAFHLLRSLSLPRGYIGVPVISREYTGHLNYLDTPETPNAPRLESPLSPPPHLSLEKVAKPTEPLPEKPRAPRDTYTPPPGTSDAFSASAQADHLQQIAAQLALLNYNVSQLTKSLLALGPLPPHGKK